MSYRFMRVVVFFDLPVTTPSDMKEYRVFRKHLIKSGFMMMQESVYCKLVPNSTVADMVIDNLTKLYKNGRGVKNKPKSGLVQALKVTENQYAKMTYIVGTKQTTVVDSDERLIFL